MCTGPVAPPAGHSAIHSFRCLEDLGQHFYLVCGGRHPHSATCLCKIGVAIGRRFLDIFSLSYVLLHTAAFGLQESAGEQGSSASLACGLDLCTVLFPLQPRKVNAAAAPADKTSFFCPVLLVARKVVPG